MLQCSNYQRNTGSVLVFSHKYVTVAFLPIGQKAKRRNVRSPDSIVCHCARARFKGNADHPG
jgi:hypothetical protein